MKSFLRLVLILFFAVMLCSWAIAQTSPASQDDSSLAVTMQFIQNELSHLGKVNYAAYNHDKADGSDWTTHFSTELTNVVADPAACKLSYHEKRIVDGKVTSDKNYSFLLSTIKDVVIIPRKQLLKNVNTKNGHPTWDAMINPPVSVVAAQQSDNGEFYFYVLDDGAADRITKAMNHAVTLCGGGNKGSL